ncbi:hypothetical protein [uncultured Tateyamaria sp.]|nr:hypothetical protein [uncultured Tateyamaria sp.]
MTNLPLPLKSIALAVAILLGLALSAKAMPEVRNAPYGVCHVQTG